MKKLLYLACLILALTIIVNADDCSNFNYLVGCKSGTQTEYPADWNSRRFQTPPKDTDTWFPTYQDMHIIVGYCRTTYSADKTQATVTFITTLNENSDVIRASNSYNIQYVFGNEASTSSPTITVSSNSLNTLLTAAAYVYDDNGNQIASLILEPLDFIWNHPTVNQPSNYLKGQKGAIIEMFGWPYQDIEQECEALGKMGWLGVKVYPPNESILNFNWTENGELNPWWFIYQPVSYKLASRMGNLEQLRSMINTCRSHGVRVYADAVVNHMTGGGNDMFPSHRNPSGSYCNYWGPKNGSAGSPWYTDDFQYENVTWTGQYPGLEFPSVPYGPDDFHCERSLNSWNDPFQLNYGWLEGLSDLNSESDYVRQRIADYMTELLSIGFSGFRMDAAKHIAPVNLAAIFAKLKKNLGGGDLPDDFVTYLEVIIGGEKDLLMCSDNAYNYGSSFTNLMKAAGLSDNDIYRIKIWESDYPKEFPICGYWPIPSERYVAENDCSDDQFPGSSSRDMGSSGSILVSTKDVNMHRYFESQLFSRTDGNWQIKLVLSSYTFMNYGAYGFPDGSSDCRNCQNSNCTSMCTKTVPYAKAHDPNVCGYTVYDSSNNWAQGAYTRVHRDMTIILSMRRWMGLSTSVSASDLGLPSSCSASEVYEMIE